MKHLKKFNEMTEFTSQRFTQDSSGSPMSINDPQLSMDSYDQHRSGVISSMRRLNDIMNSLTNTGYIFSVGSSKYLSGQEIKNIKIQRMYPNGANNLDVYLTFEILDKEYFGVIKNFDTINPEIKSEVFTDGSLVISKEWIIRTKGLLLKCVKMWMNIEKGDYVCMKDILVTSTITGELYNLRKSKKIKVIKCYDNKIIAHLDNNECLIDGVNFYYFNWWFEKV